MKTIIYQQCFEATTNNHLCNIGYTFFEELSPASCYGRIEATLLYHEPGQPENRIRKHLNRQTWYTNPDGEYCMGVSKFSIPPCLQGYGLGPVIWSEIYNNLPNEIRARLLIFGSLTSVDAYTPLMDAERKPIREFINGKQRVKLLNQIERRNRFWSGMLTPQNDNTPVLRCDAAGNGGFSGYFRNPLKASGSAKVIIEEISDKPQMPTPLKRMNAG